MTQLALFLLYTLVINICTATVLEQVRMADYQIFTGTKYIADNSHNLIINITNGLVYSLADCAQYCLSYTQCQTATYYIQKHTCSLYGENSGIGTAVSVGTQIASVISINNREPSGNIKEGHCDSNISYRPCYCSRKMQDAIFCCSEIRTEIWNKTRI